MLNNNNNIKEFNIKRKKSINFANKKESYNRMKIPFSVSARTAMLIGSENFSNPEGAIVELVKNAYDADSHYCYILFGEDEQNNRILYILDWGTGMTDKIIETCWMRIGTDDKLYNATTESGRVKSGAKGIGRFALNRLGMKAEMLTFTKDGHGYDWKVNWSDFDKPGTSVSEITADIDIISLAVGHQFLSNLGSKFGITFPKFETGTLLSVTELNDEWDDEQLEHLYSSLQDLVPPFNIPVFDIYLYVQGNDGLGRIELAEYDDYDYSVSAVYDGKDSLKVKVLRNELDVERLRNDYVGLFQREDMREFPYRLSEFEAGGYELSLSMSKLKVDNRVRLANHIKELGAFRFNFFFVKSAKSDGKGEGDEAKYPYRLFSPSCRREWLKRNVGVKIYRDKFRVRPYGENGDDWLHLGDRYSANPIGAGQRKGGYHIRQNQIVGAVEISRLDNIYLQDKSGREGLQENVVVELFKDILLGIIGLMEKDRNTVMFNLSQLYDTLHPKGTAKAEAEEAIKKGKIDEESYNKIRTGYLVLKQEAEERENEIRLLRNLASTGLVITSFAHELKNIAILSDSRSEDLRCAVENIMSEEDVAKLGLSEYDNPYSLIRDLRNQDQNIRSWLNFSINSINRDKRTRKTFGMDEYFEHFQSTWHTVLDELNIDLVISGFSPEMRVRAFVIDLDTIFNNLLSNSIYAIKESKKNENRLITIKGGVEDENIVVLFEDTGIGLAEEYKGHPNDIFNAFESSKYDQDGNKIGTGLGLYITKATLAEYKGSAISVMTPRTVGFGLCIRLKMY